MLLTFATALAQTEITTNFLWIVIGLLGLGGLGWLMAAALGFARARAYGESARWFAVSAVCMLLYHVQWLVFGVYGFKERNMGNVLAVGALPAPLTPLFESATIPDSRSTSPDATKGRKARISEVA